MHNVEFLPDWYSDLYRRKCAVMIQAGLSAGILLALTMVLIAREWNIHGQQQILAQCAQQMSRCDQQLTRLDQVLSHQHQLRLQEQAISQLGADVGASRLVGALENAMPTKMTLTGLSVETQGQSALPVSETPVGPPLERYLNVRMQGVAPTDIEVAILLDRLSKLKFLDAVAMSYIRDRTEAGHAMRDFELRFRVDLNVLSDGRS